MPARVCMSACARAWRLSDRRSACSRIVHMSMMVLQDEQTWIKEKDLIDLANLSLHELHELGMEPALKHKLWNRLQRLEFVCDRFD